MKRLQHLIIDYDDTLVVTRTARVKLVVEILDTLDIECSTDAVEAAWGAPFRSLLCAVAPALLDDAVYDRFYEAYTIAALAHRPAICPGARELLAAARRHETAVHVLTSSTRLLVERGLVMAGLQDLVTTVHSADDTEYHKPDPRVIDHLVHVDAWHPDRANSTVLVGDSIDDWRVAMHHGLPFVGVESGGTSKEEFTQAGVPMAAVFPDLVTALHHEPLSWLKN